MCGWHGVLADLVKPVISAMRDDALKQPYLCIDATGVLVQHKERCRLGHFWVLVAPERHVLFEYTRDHTSAAVDEVLSDYQGCLVTDAHAVYDHVYKTGNVVEVNCWAHVRRYFFKALESDPDRAKVALGFIGSLFRSNDPLQTRRDERRKRFERRDRVTSSKRFSRGAMRSPRRFSMTHRLLLAFAMREINVSGSRSSSKTVAFRFTTT